MYTVVGTQNQVIIIVEFHNNRIYCYNIFFVIISCSWVIDDFVIGLSDLYCGKSKC